MCLVGLEVRVDVLLAVLWIDEAMEAVTGSVVVVLVNDVDGVVVGEQPAWQGQPKAIPLRLCLAAVDFQQVDRSTAEIKKDRAFAFAGEADRDVAAIRGAAGSYVEVD